MEDKQLILHTSKINVKQRNCSTAKNIRREKILHKAEYVSGKLLFHTYYFENMVTTHLQN